MAGDRPMGIEAIARTMRIAASTLRLIHEPYLVAQGYVVRGARGREATRKARRRFGGASARAS